MSPDHKPTVAVLGTGTMGAPMARNMLDAGLDVRVWNRTFDRAKALEQDGAKPFERASDAAEGSDLVVTMLSDGDAVDAAMSGQDGGLAGMSGEAVWVQMSTVGIAWTKRFGEVAAERGVTFVDAPVSGTKEPAEQGKLIVLASGPADAVERAEPVFDAVGSKTIRAGEAPAGTCLKLVVNTWLLTVVEGLAETIAFAEKLQIDPQLFLDTIEGGPLGPAYAQLKGKQMIERKFPASFSLKLAHKDAQLVEEAAQEFDASIPVVEVVERQMRRAIELDHGDEDMAATFLASIDE